MARAVLRVEGTEVVTSMGARFPISHARRGLALVRMVRARGVEWVRNGHTLHLGHYAVDSVDVEGNVRAGCHRVLWVDIERIAEEIERAEVVSVEGTEVDSNG